MFLVLGIAATCERGYSLGIKLIHSVYCPHELTTHLTTMVGTDKSAGPNPGYGCDAPPTRRDPSPWHPSGRRLSLACIPSRDPRVVVSIMDRTTIMIKVPPLSHSPQCSPIPSRVTMLSSSCANSDYNAYNDDGRVHHSPTGHNCGTPVQHAQLGVGRGTTKLYVHGGYSPVSPT